MNSFKQFNVLLLYCEVPRCGRPPVCDRLQGCRVWRQLPHRGPGGEEEVRRQLISHLHPCPVQVGVVAVLAPDLRQRAELGVGAGGLHAARTHRGRLLGAERGGARGGRPAGPRPHGRRVQFLQQQHRVVRVRLCVVFCTGY